MNWQQACELPYYGGSDLGANPAAEEINTCSASSKDASIVPFIG